MNLIPIYLKNITFKMEKVRNDEVRVAVCSLFIQPLTYDIAKLMGVESELYMGPNKPVDIIRKVELSLGQGKRTHAFKLHATVDGSTAPSFSTDDAFLSPSVKVRRDKEAPIFAATFEVNFTYPPAKDLLMLANGLNQQYWVNLEPTNPGLFEEADKEAARDEKKRKAKDGATPPSTAIN